MTIIPQEQDGHYAGGEYKSVASRKLTKIKFNYQLKNVASELEGVHEYVGDKTETRLGKYVRMGEPGSPTS